MIFKDIIKLIRVKQWTKNAFVIAPVIFAGKLFNYNSMYIAISAFILFCLASSSVYILNDILDYKIDKLHPNKKSRPIANGQISIKFAFLLYALFFLSSTILSFLFSKVLFYIILSYLILNLFYSKYLKHIVILDVLVVAFGYVLRVLAGILPLNLNMSPWILGATLTVTLMITLAKRYAELTTHDKSEQRAILQQYDKDFLNAMLVLTSGLTITIYLLWCIQDPINVNNKMLIFSSMFVFYGVLRYLYLTIKVKSTENPSDLVFKDIPLVVNGVLWTIYMLTLIYI